MDREAPFAVRFLVTGTLQSWTNVAMPIPMDHTDVHDRAGFARYVVKLLAELDDPELAQKWENTDLRSFLEMMEAWASDSEKPVNSNPWRHAADVVRAGLIYE